MLVDFSLQMRHSKNRRIKSFDRYAQIVHTYTYMRTTLNIDDKMLKKAAELTGVEEKTSLVRLGLQALIANESSRRLARLGGSQKGLRPIPRRRMRAK
jgi:Arc/MetJ family transcription regulator